MNAIPKILPFSDLRVRQSEVLDMLSDEPIVLAQRGRPAAVLVSVEAWNDLIERLEEAEDALDAIEAQRHPESAMELEEYMAKRGHGVPTNA
jgi:prevent-host-death family protein